MALGNIAQQFLRQLDIDLVAYVAQVGPVETDSEKPLDVSEIRQKIFQNDMHVIDQDKVEDLHQLISVQRLRKRVIHWAELYAW
ncbi:hypothetical protein [Lactobacillus delbrueckii]|uniref:hypothetical protein n=1 Tax=Lactobacillus delbrueckii TaxID=1584 RepID=UPI003A89586E